MKRMTKSTDKIDSQEPVRDEPSKEERRNIVLASNAVITLYALCYWIQIGVMPYLTRNLGVDAKMFGYLQSVFAFVQLCGGPLYGRFGDLFGGKYALIIAFMSCVASFGLLSVAATIPVLFLSRLPSVLMHCMQGAQMVITDVTTKEDRASGIGKLGISYGIGMVIGPLLGGFITDHFNEQTAAFMAALGSVLSIVIVIWTVPENTKDYNPDNRKTGESKSSGSLFDYGKYASIFQVPHFTYLFAIKIITGLPIGIFQAMFSIFAMDYFHLEAKHNGMVLSYVGVMSMIVQGVGIPFLTKNHSESNLIKYSVLATTVGYFLLTFVQNIYVFMVILLPLICGGAVLTVIITSVITKTVSSADTGAALGLSMATNSLIRTISPTIGGLLYTTFGFPVFGVSGTLVNGLLFIYLFVYGKESLSS